MELFCSVIISFCEFSSFGFILVVDIEVGKSVNILLYKEVGESVDIIGGILIFIAVDLH